jgi:hypothetical protein
LIDANADANADADRRDPAHDDNDDAPSSAERFGDSVTSAARWQQRGGCGGDDSTAAAHSATAAWRRRGGDGSAAAAHSATAGAWRWLRRRR